MNTGRVAPPQNHCSVLPFNHSMPRIVTLLFAAIAASTALGGEQTLPVEWCRSLPIITLNSDDGTGRQLRFLNPVVEILPDDATEILGHDVLMTLAVFRGGQQFEIEVISTVLVP